MDNRSKEQIEKDHKEFLDKKKSLGYIKEDECQYDQNSENYCLLKQDCICSRVNMNKNKL